MGYYQVKLPELDRSLPPPSGWDKEKVKLFEENKKLVPYFVMRFKRKNSWASDEDLEDINSEINALYFELIGKYDPDRGCKFASYMQKHVWGIFRNKMRELYGDTRSGKKRPVTVSLSEISYWDEVFLALDNSENPEDVFLEKDTLGRCLAVLDKEHYKAIYSYYFHGKTQAEIAREEQSNQSAVSRMIRHSVRMMRNIFIHK